MNDDQRLRADLADAGLDPTDEFRALLQERLEATLSGDTFVGLEPQREEGSRHGLWWALSAAAIVAVLAAVAIVREPWRQPVAVPSTTIDTVVATVATELPSTSVASTTTFVPAQAVAVRLRHGVTVDLPAYPVTVRDVDTLAYWAERADYVAQMTLPDGAVLRLRVSSGELPNFCCGGEIAASADRDLGDVRVRLESILTLNLDTQTLEGPVLETDALEAIVATLTYDAAADLRVRPTAAVGLFSTAPPTCTDAGSVEAPVLLDLVLFLCDGTFGVFDGQTGELVELIRQFEDTRVPHEGEGSGPAYVDGIDVSPDGSIIYFSTGPEPASGNLYRYVRGSGVEPEPLGNGWGPSRNPYGDRLAAAGASDQLSIVDLDDPTRSRSIPLFGMYAYPPFAWSADGGRVAFQAGTGVIGIADLASGDVELYAPTETGEAYFDPRFRMDDALDASLVCCDGAAGSLVEVAVVGAPGNNVPVERVGDGQREMPWRRVGGNGGSSLFLAGDVLRGPGGAVLGRGVLQAIALP